MSALIYSGSFGDPGQVVPSMWTIRVIPPKVQSKRDAYIKEQVMMCENQQRKNDICSQM